MKRRETMKGTKYIVQPDEIKSSVITVSPQILLKIQNQMQEEIVIIMFIMLYFGTSVIN